jgi:transposase
MPVRDVDKMQREHLAEELGRLKRIVRSAARSYTDAGKIGALHLFDRLDRRLDGLSQSIRFADYGQSGFFDVVKVYDEELDKLYRFDLSILEDLAEIETRLAEVPAPGDDDPKDALDRALSRLEELSDKWARRDNVIASVVQQG